MNTVFDFEAQLEIGNIGETIFMRKYASLGPIKSKDRKFDFMLADGRTVELKSDTYPMDKTPNFFMEIYGNVEEAKIGGPWRALQDGVNLFVYQFVINRTFFWFDTIILCQELDKIIAQGNVKMKEIKNRSWIARGYTIPRELLIPFLLRQDTFKD